MRLMLDRFYPIADDAAWLRRILPLGAKLVQLRIKDKAEAEIRRQVREAAALCGRHGAQLIVNDHWRIAIEEGCDFVHLGQGDLDGADLPALRRAGVRLGVSTHDRAELDRALSIAPAYVALGPIYPTTLKEMPWAPQGLDRIGAWKGAIGDRPLVAIGGLTVERAAGVLAAGADSLAVVSDVLWNADPEARVGDWIAAVRRAA